MCYMCYVYACLCMHVLYAMCVLYVVCVHIICDGQVRMCECSVHMVCVKCDVSMYTCVLHVVCVICGMLHVVCVLDTWYLCMCRAQQRKSDIPFCHYLLYSSETGSFIETEARLAAIKS